MRKNRKELRERELLKPKLKGNGWKGGGNHWRKKKMRFWRKGCVSPMIPGGEESKTGNTYQRAKVRGKGWRETLSRKLKRGGGLGGYIS